MKTRHNVLVVALLIEVLILAACQPAAGPQQKMAYVSGGKLFVAYYNGFDAHEVDSCPDTASCSFWHLSWSPDGANLMYLKTTLKDGESVASLNIVGEDGTARAAVDRSNTLSYVVAPTWSPDGQHLAYAVRTSDYRPLSQDQPADNLIRASGGDNRVEIWIIDAPFGDNGRKAGDIHITAGCGGAGFIASEPLYYHEGLGTFPRASASLRLAWTPTDILLYSRTCLSSGLGRLDLKTGRELPPLDEANLLAFTMNFPRQRWAATSQNNQIALGDPTQLPFTFLPVTGTAQLGGVFFGPTSGRLYYTTRQVLVTTAAIDNEAYLDIIGFMPVSFSFYQTMLFAVENENVEQAKQLLQADAYGYGSLTETATGDILFVRIDNEQALYEAMKTGQPANSLASLWPKPQIIRLPADGGAPEVLIDNAGQLALAPAR